MNNGKTAATDELSFQEAAVRLDLSEKTLRKRLETGEVLGWKEREGGREVWRVRVPAECREEEAAAAGTPGTPGTPGSDLPAVSPEYRDLLLRHETACVQLGRLQAREERMPVLEADIAKETQKALAAAYEANLVREDRDRLRGRIRALAAVAPVLGLLVGILAGWLMLRFPTGGGADDPRREVPRRGGAANQAPVDGGSPSAIPHTPSLGVPRRATPREAPSGHPEAIGPSSPPALGE